MSEINPHVLADCLWTFYDTSGSEATTGCALHSGEAWDVYLILVSYLQKLQLGSYKGFWFGDEQKTITWGSAIPYPSVSFLVPPT